MLEAQKIDSEISKLIYDEFGIDLVVSFMEVQAFDIDKAVAEAVKVKQEEKQKQIEEAEKNTVHEMLGRYKKDYLWQSNPRTAKAH